MNAVNLDRLYYAYKLLIDAAEKKAAADVTRQSLQSTAAQNTTAQNGSNISLPAAADSRQQPAGGE